MKSVKPTRASTLGNRGECHPAMDRWHVEPLKWHYLARFWRGPISESQVKAQVRIILPRGRYTLVRSTREIVAKIGVFWSHTEVVKTED